MRAVNKFDIPSLREMIREFRSESPLSFLRQIDDEANFDGLITRIIAGAGVAFIEEGKGFILGVVAPSVWSPDVLLLSELAWYVRPEYRNSTVGYRLMKAYIDAGKAMKESGRVKAFTIAKMVSSPDIKYQKFGFSKLEETWIQ